jgi:cellular nucleic acid-binding protein
VQRSQAAQNTAQALPIQKYYNCGERGHYFSGCSNPCIHLPSARITNTAPTSGEKTAKVCFHCGQSGHFAFQCPDRCQRQTPLDKNCYNYEEKGHFVVTCSNPRSRPPLPPSRNAAPNHKGGSISVKATTSCFNYGQVGQYTNRCPDQD